MEKNRQAVGSDELLYGINDKPKLATQILLGFQNIFIFNWNFCTSNCY